MRVSCENRGDRATDVTPTARAEPSLFEKVCLRFPSGIFACGGAARVSEMYSPLGLSGSQSSAVIRGPPWTIAACDGRSSGIRFVIAKIQAFDEASVFHTAQRLTSRGS